MPQLRILKCSSTGEFKHTENWLTKLLKIDPESIFKKYGEKGVKALQDATPKRSGLTANSWTYDYTLTRNSYGGITSGTITWSNTNTSQNIPIIILIECGHGTRNGGYVPPNPFISDAVRPVLDDMAKELWKEVRDQ